MILAAAVFGGGTASPGRAAIKPDETVLFFPALARPAAGGWQVDARGIVFEPGERPRQAALFGRLLGIDLDALTVDERRIFSQRTAPFLVDHERGKRLVLVVGNTSVRFRKSAPNGQFEGTFYLPSSGLAGAAALPEAKRPARARVAKVAGTLQPAPTGSVPAEFPVHLIADEGWSVISDIDDTIKISHVLDKRELIRGTFCRPFEVVPGMAATYQQWEKGGAQFHYLSASPWQLYPALQDFLDTHSFPAGTFHLKQFRLKDASALEMLGRQTRYKADAIDSLMTRWPRRNYLLVGDSGEQDPEVYGEAARRHPGRVRHIFIRNVTGQGPDHARYRKAFRGQDSGSWTIFDESARGSGALLRSFDLPAAAADRTGRGQER